MPDVHYIAGVIHERAVSIYYPGLVQARNIKLAAPPAILDTAQDIRRNGHLLCFRLGACCVPTY